MSKKNVLFIGGDERQLYCAKKLLEKGYEISIYGFDKYSQPNDLFMNFKVLKIAVILADVVVFPTPFLYSEYLYMPYSDEKIKAEEIIKYLDSTKIVFGSAFGEQIKKKFEKAQVEYFDFLDDEPLAVLNAELTAQGAVNIICNKLKSSLCENKILILGYGRISKNLVRILLSFRAKITVGARKKSDLTWAKIHGTQAKEIKNIDYSEYNIVINTIPANVLSNKIIEENNSALFLDLAPQVNVNAPNYLAAKALPGKFAPKTAGNYLAEIILNKTEGEENE